MKRLLIFITIFTTLYFIFNTSVLAVSPTSENETEKVNTNLINDLKDRIASRVAQLKLVERRGIIGTVTEVTDTQITISDLQNDTRFVDVDELTKFASPASNAAKEAFGISDIIKGSKIGILGLYNKQTKRTLARFINVLTLPKSVHGSIILKDEENFTLTILSENGRKTIIDIEKITKTQSFTKEDGLVKFGFSKIKGNEKTIIIGFTDIKDKNRVIASRILLFPEIPRDPKIIMADPAVSENQEVSPSTGSGKKLTPITK